MSGNVTGSCLQLSRCSRRKTSSVHVLMRMRKINKKLADIPKSGVPHRNLNEFGMKSGDESKLKAYLVQNQ